MRWPLAALLTLAACTQAAGTFWVRPGATPADFAAASSACESQALARAPYRSLGMAGYFGANRTWCQSTPGGTNCLPINPGYLPQAGSAADENAGAREILFRSCMVSAGWHPGDGEIISPVPVVAEAAVGQALSYCETKYPARRKAEFDQCVMGRLHGAN